MKLFGCGCGREQLERIERLLKILIARSSAELSLEVEMDSKLDALKTQVAENSAVIGSAITLIQGLHDKLQAAIDAGDPAALQALADELKAKDQDLAAAVAANTPAESAPAPQADGSGA